MSKIRYAIVGSGWRSLFYIRIAKALPEQFEVTAVLVRSEEKKKRFEEEYGVFATLDKAELLATNPDFVVVVVSGYNNAKVAIEYLSDNIPVFAETPPAYNIDDLNAIWKLVENGGKMQVAEQYFLYPTYEAKLKVAQDGYLGEIQNAALSALHEYHAISILRLALGVGLENVKITAKKFDWDVAVTQNKNGVLQKGELSGQSRVRADFEFESGKVAFYDFCGIQYHSHIRHRYLAIQGTRGEVFGDSVWYLNEDNFPMHETLNPVTNGIHPAIESIAFAGKTVYRNPFPTNLMPEDETAIARLLIGMKEYIETGKELYSLADAMQDAYLTTLLKKAVDTGETVVSEDQVWKK